MRFETIYASQYLVWRLQYANAVLDTRDDGDTISVDLKNGDHIQIIMWERGISADEIRYYFKYNTRRNIYTLMLIWVDMFLPSDNTLYAPDDWMQMLMTLHGNQKVYAYEVQGRDSYFFPVYFEGNGYRKRIRYGNVVNYAHIGGHTTTTRYADFTGDWQVGGFDQYGQTYDDDPFHEHQRYGSPLAIYYAVLGLDDQSPIEDVKLAYRQLARQFHPDVSDTRDAHRRMAQINDAYQRISQHLMLDDDL